MSAFIFPCFLTKDTGYLLFNSNTTAFQTKETKETFNSKTLALKRNSRLATFKKKFGQNIHPIYKNQFSLTQDAGLGLDDTGASTESKSTSLFVTRLSTYMESIGMKQEIAALFCGRFLK